MRPFLASSAAVALTVLLPGVASAQTQVGPYLAFHDDQDLGVGGFFKVAVPSIEPGLWFGADVGAFFPDDSPGIDREYFELNLDAFWEISVSDPSLSPFVMGGLRIGHASVTLDSPVIDASGSDTALALNAGAGVEFGTGDVRPVAGVKIELGDGSAFVLFGRLAFGRGRN
jgi:hypothetical protein